MVDSDRITPLSKADVIKISSKPPLIIYGVQEGLLPALARVAEHETT